MLKWTKSDGIPDYKKYLDMHQGYIYMESTISFAMHYDSEQLKVMQDRLNDMIYIGSGGQIKNSSNKENVITYLIEHCGVAPDDMRHKDTMNSLADEVMVRLRKYPLARDFVTLYREYSSHKSSISSMRSILERAEQNQGDKSFRNLSVYKIKYDMTTKKTGRFYSSNENIQSIPKKYLEYVCAEPGRFLLSTDFKAFEPSIQFYVLYYDESLAEGFLRTKDPYEFMYYVTNPNHKEFTKEYRNKWKFPFLQSVYGQGLFRTQMELGDEAAAKNLHNWLANNSRRKTYQQNIKQRFERKEEIIVTTYFGNRIASNTARTSEEAIRDFSNYPVQGTAHDIVTKYVLEFVAKLNAVGVTDIRLPMSRHDEPVFSFRSEDMRKVVEVHRECNRIQIDNWRPITCDGIISYLYGQPVATITPEVITEDELREIQHTRAPHYFPIRTKVNAVVCSYFIPDNDGSMIGLVYAKSQVSSNIYAKVFKDPSNIGPAIDVAVRSLLIENPDYDYRIVTNAPIAGLLKETSKLIDEEALFTSLDIEVLDVSSVDFNTISNLLYNAKLEPKAYPNGVFDCGLIFTPPILEFREPDKGVND